MTSERAGESSVAGRIPSDARIIALVLDETSGLSRAVERVAAAVAERRGRTLLVGAGPIGGLLDEEFATSDAPGLAEVLAGKARFADVARRPLEARFLYLPAGRSTGAPDPQALRALMDRVRAADGTLLLALPPDRAGLPAESFDVELEYLDAAAPAAPAEEAPEEGTEAPVPASLAEAFQRSEPERWRRHRLASGAPFKRIALATAVLLALLGGWWLLARLVTAQAPGPEVGSSGSLPAEPPGVDLAGDRTAETPSAPDAESEAATDRPADGVGAPTTLPDASIRTALAEAPELSYSVLVASYTSLEDALTAARRAGAETRLLFVAPTPVRGRVYHRLFAGALPSRAAARALMSELTNRGIKESSSDWDIRPASFSYRLSVHPDPGSARQAMRALIDRGVPCYGIRLVAEGDTVHQVYAGAYEGPQAAVAMRELLNDAGVNAELVPRRGEPR